MINIFPLSIFYCVLINKHKVSIKAYLLHGKAVDLLSEVDF